MGLPDKLYINKYMIRPGMLHPAEFPPDNPEWEYIRKDALMELLLSLEARYSVFYLQGKVIRDVIDKINSL